jgi:hypothetical protein
MYLQLSWNFEEPKKIVISSAPVLGAELHVSASSLEEI